MGDYSTSHAVHIFADSGPALARMRATAQAAGCRIVSASLTDADRDPAAFAVPGAALLIELEKEDADAAVIALLDRVGQEAESGARRSVVSAPAGLIDLVAARTFHPVVAHLCGAEEDERIAAIVGVGRTGPARLYDSGRGEVADLTPSSSLEEGDAAEPDVDAGTIRAMIRARRLRARYFRGDLFADPAWDILLDLMAARLEGHQVPVSSLCIAAAVPTTTALRWIQMLTERGLLVRVADRKDRRVVYIELSDGTARALGNCLRTMKQISVLPD